MTPGYKIAEETEDKEKNKKKKDKKIIKKGNLEKYLDSHESPKWRR